MYKRPILNYLLDRLREPRQFIQLLSGPRQTGKTTLARQVAEDFDVSCHYAFKHIPAVPRARKLIVGGAGIPMEDFFSTPVNAIF